MRIAAVIPVRNKADVLERCLGSIVRAAQAYPDTEVIVVDNGSSDGSIEIAQQFREQCVVIKSSAPRVGAVRNDGARRATDSEVLAFIDCDCEIPADFFVAVAATLDERGAAAVGCEVVSPANGHWSERVWDQLHRPGGDGPRHYINSACFCIRTTWFDAIRGFDEQKTSSEDVDICRRLAAAGGTMWQSERLAIVHWGNPQSVAGLFRRIRWHGEGIWEPEKGIQWSVSTAATFAYPFVVASGLGIGATLIARGDRAGWLYVLVAPLVVPLAFVFARAAQHRRAVPLIGGVALMLITFHARLAGIWRSVVASRASTPNING